MFSDIIRKKRIRAIAAVLSAVILALAILSAGTGFSPRRAYAKEESKVIYFCDNTLQGNPRQFNIFGSVGFRFEVPEGYKLDAFNILAAPTWGDQPNAGFTADIYAWESTYSQSISGAKLSSCSVSYHMDNHSIQLKFGYIPAGTYLIHIHAFTGPIGTWEYMALPAEYVSTWAFYQDGVEEIEYLPGTSINVTTDNDPHEITMAPATGTPDPDENQEEETPEPTPKATRGRITSEPDNDGHSSSKKGSSPLPGMIIAAVMIAATAAVIVIVSKRDKKK
ncbi:MAG: hypothetical protein J5950_06065 [Clostridia bacterium]|nr:hypothetical protein [Clostridia bacterium]